MSIICPDGASMSIRYVCWGCSITLTFEGLPRQPVFEGPPAGLIAVKDGNRVAVYCSESCLREKMSSKTESTYHLGSTSFSHYQEVAAY